MPELPEVETLRRGLARGVQGRRIVEAIIANAKILKGQPEAEFRERSLGADVGTITRRGKYLLVALHHGSSPESPLHQTPDFTLCIHLKMRGQLLLEPPDASPSAYHCVSLRLKVAAMEENQESREGREAAEVWLRFYDMWTWGEMRALTDAECRAIPGLAQMGPEPLLSGWDGATLRERLGSRRTPIKTALLDQSVVAGVGNIYADESLFRSGISPTRPACSLSGDEAERLATAVRTILTLATEGGGTTSDEYVDLTGTVGRYVPLAYDRGGEPCANCGGPLTRIKLGGRGTVFCPTCQS